MAWLNSSLGSGRVPRAVACARQAAALPALAAALAQYAALYPEEGTRWNLAAADPALDARPVFFRGSPRSMLEWLPLFQRAAATACATVT